MFKVVMKPGALILGRPAAGSRQEHIASRTDPLPGLYRILGPVKDVDGQVVDHHLEKLEHISKRIPTTPVPGYRILGTEVDYVDLDFIGPRAKPISYTQLTRGSQIYPSSTAPHSVGDALREALHAGRCPQVGCQAGWLPSQEYLDPMLIRGGLPKLARFRPLCPACFGKRALQAQVSTREYLDRNGELRPVNEDEVLTLRGHLRRRSLELGIPNFCYCELCVFPLSRYPPPLNHHEAEERFNGVREYDATTPITNHPASWDAIEALPRKAWGECAAIEPKCTVCQDDFEAGSRVVELPCKHVICEDGCVNWLSRQNSCPLCRCKIPGANDETTGDEIADDAWQAGSDDPMVTDMSASFSSIGFESSGERNIQYGDQMVSLDQYRILTAGDVATPDEYGVVDGSWDDDMDEVVEEGDEAVISSVLDVRNDEHWREILDAEVASMTEYIGRRWSGTVGTSECLVSFSISIQ